MSNIKRMLTFGALSVAAVVLPAAAQASAVSGKIALIWSWGG